MTTSRVTGGQYIREMYVVRRTWSGSCDSAAGAGERSAKLEPLNLARRRLGQLRDELDPARILVGCELVLHEALELSFEAGSGGRAVLEDDEGLGLDEAVRVLVAHHRRLEHGGVAHERVLHLHGRDPDASHFEHVVGAAAVPEEAVRVLVILVARLYPVTEEGGFGLFVLIPVVRHGRVAFDAQVADLTLRHGRALVIHDARLVARHYEARGPGPGPSWLVGQEDVEDLRGADAVEDLHPEALPPALEDLLGQRLARRHAEAQRGQVVALLRLLDLQHGGVEGGHTEEDGRSVTMHHLEHRFGERAMRIEHTLGAHAEGKGHVIA